MYLFDGSPLQCLLVRYLPLRPEFIECVVIVCIPQPITLIPQLRIEKCVAIICHGDIVQTENDDDAGFELELKAEAQRCRDRGIAQVLTS